MLLSKWKSNPFMKYLWAQVCEFSNDVSTRMISEKRGGFYAVPLLHKSFSRRQYK